MATGRRDRPPGTEKARPQKHAVAHRVTGIDVNKPDATPGPDGRDAVVERTLESLDRPERSEAERLVVMGWVEIPFAGVGVGVDHARHQRATTEVDDACRARSLCL